jgi:hypothetical protein
MHKQFEVKKGDFHSQLLDKVLDGCSVPASTYPDLERTLRRINDGILAASQAGFNDKQQYWIMLTRYECAPGSQLVKAGE